MKTTFTLIVFLGMFFLCVPVQAIITGQYSGVFIYPTPASPPSVTTGIDTDSITWGIPCDGETNCTTIDGIVTPPSGLIFRAYPFSTEPEETFILGEIEFFNGTIQSGTEITNITLFLESVDISPAVYASSECRVISIVNTPNSSDARASADRVTIPMAFFPAADTFGVYESKSSIATILGRFSEEASGEFRFMAIGFGEVITDNGFLDGYALPDVFYVDDDAPNDPAPYNNQSSDSQEDGTFEHPFDSIQEAIDIAIDGKTVIVLDGTYFETINFRGKNIAVTSLPLIEASESERSYPVIDGNGSGPVVTFNHGEDPNCSLSGFVITGGNASNPPSSGPSTIELNTTVRDFLNSHPDFENGTGTELGLVQETLGPDGKPIYAKGDGSLSNTTHGAIYFDQWYRDVVCVNSRIDIPLTLEDHDGDGVYTYNSTAFYPIDNQLFGNQNQSHNFDFTLELHTRFRYQPGQVFDFTGDDDLFVFINGLLVVDLGGVHGTKSTSIDLDTLDLQANKIYTFDLFYANRNSGGSRLRIDTSIILEPREQIAGAIACINSSPTLRNCIITGNRCYESNDSVVYCVGSDALFENCTMADNLCGENGAALSLVDSNAKVLNSIIWGNLGKQILAESHSTPVITYSNIQGQWPGPGNIEIDPSFARTGYWADPNDPEAIWIAGDYHLMSKGGRWDPLSLAWVNDVLMSPCIDAGDPTSSWHQEPLPNGERINMGAYGGTPQASLSWTKCTLSTSSTDGGSISTPGEGLFEYDCETVVPIESLSETCHHFVGWTGTAVEAGAVADANAARTTVTVDADYTLVANFTLDEPTLTISSTDGGSVVVPGEGVFTYDCGTSVRLEVEAEPCYYFSHWTGTAIDGKVADPYDPNLTVVVNEDCTIIAHFVKIQYNLTIGSSEHGSVTVPGEGTFTYECGTSVPIEATPDTHCYFTGWTGTAVDKGKVANPNDPKTTVTVDGNYTLQANFAIYQHTIQFSSTEGGYANLTITYENTSISWLDPRTIEVDEGTLVTLTASPEPGYKFSHWSGSVSTTTNPVAFTVNHDHNLTANFIPIDEES